jgi:hypothetical protein
LGGKTFELWDHVRAREDQSVHTDAKSVDEGVVSGQIGTVLEKPMPIRARLASVTDLQLVLPEVLPVPSECDKDEFPLSASPAEHPATQSSPPHAHRGPSPIVRPVIRSLIADVIDEMNAPENKPAHVTGGLEITLPSSAWRHRKPTPCALDEDIIGRRLGVNPPPYEDAAPPPYEDSGRATSASQSSEGWMRAQKLLEAQTQSLAQAQAQVQTQMQMLAMAQTQAQGQRDEALQLARAVQQQAHDAQQRIAATVEQQTVAMQRNAQEVQQQLAESVRQVLERDTASVEQQLAFAVQQSVTAAQAALAGTLPRTPPQQLPHTSQVDGQVLPALLDSLQRLEVNFQQQLSHVMRVQAEERNTHLSVLRSMQQAPRTVQAIVPLAPPQAPAPSHVAPAAATADAAAQVSLESPRAEIVDGEAQACFGPSEEHEARVARFTDYLLHGPTGHREPPRGGLAPPLTPWPLPADFHEVDTMLAEALGGPPPVVETESSETDTFPVSSSEMEDLSTGEATNGTLVSYMSPGEVTASELSGNLATSSGEVQDSSVGEVSRGVSVVGASFGEVTHSEPSVGEIWSDGLSNGELPHTSLLDASSDSVAADAFGLSAGEVSGVSEVTSSGQVPSSGVCSAEAVSSGEVAIDSVYASSTQSEGEALEEDSGELESHLIPAGL